jgi:hypothetical protein
LANGLGLADGLHLAGVMSSPGGTPTAEDIRNALNAAEGRVDALVSFCGLPQDLEMLAGPDGELPYAVAAYFPGKVADPAVLRQWLQDGLVQVVVLKPDGEMRSYTPENLPPSSW